MRAGQGACSLGAGRPGEDSRPAENEGYQPAENEILASRDAGTAAVPLDGRDDSADRGTQLGETGARPRGTRLGEAGTRASGKGHAPCSLVFSDLDDSFLTRDKSVTETNLAALDALVDLGVGFVPCTGRTISGVPDLLRHHPATRFLVGSNGGAIAEAATGRVVWRGLMDIELVCRVYERVRDLDISFDCFVGEQVFCERARYEAIATYGLSEHNLRTVRSIRVPYDATIPELIASTDGVEKITLYWPNDAVGSELAARLAEFAEVDATSSAFHNFEIMAHGVSKGAALRRVCEIAGYDVATTVAFGDAANDAEMLAAAGLGVAMANATPEAKAAADALCGDCDDSGVGRHLLQLMSTWSTGETHW